jgi:hypothetical protein
MDKSITAKIVSSSTYNQLIESIHSIAKSPKRENKKDIIKYIKQSW